MQKREKKFSADHRSSFWIKLSFGIGHPPAIHQMQCICVGEGSRVPNLQTEFNYLNLFKSYGIFSDFVVPTWSPSSLRCPCHPHIIPIIPMSSPHHPRCPHIIPIAPRRSPCGLHGLWSLWSPHVVPVVLTSSPHRPHIIPTSSLSSPSSSHHPHSPQKVPMWSPWSVVSVVSTCCPRCPHVIPTSSPSSPHHPCCPHVVPTLSPSSSRCPHSPQKVPMWSPWSVVSVVSCCPRHPHVIPIIPMSSPHHLEGLHIIPNPPDTHPTHPPTPWGVGAPNQ